jgi:transcriptional regulator with XRE-family HTH domain
MKDDFSKKLGEWLADKRKLAGMTQTQVAEKIGSQKQRISNWETGYREMNAKDLVQYCEIIGADLDELADFFRRSTHAGV